MSYTKTYLYGYLIKSFYLSAKQSDLVLVVDGHRLFAHKFVLSSKSVIFRKMFFGPFRESIDKEVVIKDTNLEAFKLLLKYCYYEELSPKDWSTNDHNLVIEVFKCAHLYQIRYLCLISELKLIGLLSADNAIDIFELGCLYGSKRINCFVEKFAKSRGKELIGSKVLLNCESKETVEFFMKAIRIDKPLDAFKTLVAIVDRNKDWTLKEFYDFIRFKDLTIEDLEYIRNNISKYYSEISIEIIIKLKEQISDLTQKNDELSTQLKTSVTENNQPISREDIDMEWNDIDEDLPSEDESEDFDNWGDNWGNG